MYIFKLWAQVRRWFTPESCQNYVDQSIILLQKSKAEVSKLYRPHLGVTFNFVEHITFLVLRHLWCLNCVCLFCLFNFCFFYDSLYFVVRVNHVWIFDFRLLRTAFFLSYLLSVALFCYSSWLLVSLFDFLFMYGHLLAFKECKCLGFAYYSV